MVQYRDFPDASRIYELALKRRPKKAAEPPSPSSPLAAMVKMPAPAGPDPLNEKATILNARLYELIEKGQPQAAELLLNEPGTAEALPPWAFDRARAEIATSYYGQGEDAKAYELAAAGAERSSDTVAQGHWTAGLAAYRMGQLETAAFHFGQHALSPAAGPWNVSAGAYWAARVLLQIRQPARVERWLRVAAEHHRTFYGQIAQRALGLDSPLDWSAPTVQQEDINRVLKLPGGRRAIALVQMGELVLAEEELRIHVWKLDAAYARSLLAVADAAGLPNTSVRAGARLAQFGAETGDRVLYPEPPWTPLQRLHARPGPDVCLHAAGIRLLQPRHELRRRRRADAAHAGDGHADRDGSGYAGERPARAVRPDRQSVAWPAISGVAARPSGHHRGTCSRSRSPTMPASATCGSGKSRSTITAIRCFSSRAFPPARARNFVERILANFWIYRERLGQPTPVARCGCRGGVAALHPIRPPRPGDRRGCRELTRAGRSCRSTSPS